MEKRKSLLKFIIDFNLTPIYIAQILFAISLSKITGQEVDSTKNKKRANIAVCLFYGLLLLALFIMVISP